MPTSIEKERMSTKRALLIEQREAQHTNKCIDDAQHMKVCVGRHTILAMTSVSVAAACPIDEWKYSGMLSLRSRTAKRNMVHAHGGGMVMKPKDHVP